MKTSLRSWGQYPDHPQHGHPCHWRDSTGAIIEQVAAAHGSTLAYGNGRSYGDSCLAQSDQVIHMSGLNRFIHADWEAGIIAAEAGVTLAEILAVSIPRGWFLSVTPGTGFATLGGAIANDVHGKNHHRRGTFGNHLRRFGLWRQGNLLECSCDENTELFAATIGGLGLTGVISWAEIQLQPIHSSELDCQQVRFGNIDEFFSLSDELDHQHEYSVAWVDCLASGAQAGRGVYISGDHAADGPLQVTRKAQLSVPLTPPLSLINRLSLRAFNTFYWHHYPARRTRVRQDYEPFFYPLDRIQHWNRIYGRRGFQQYQCVVPEQDAAEVMKAVLGEIASAGLGSFLAVLKRCGDIASPGLLSFPLAGTSLALDFAQQPRLNASLFPRLDRLVHEAGGRLYPAKDAHMRGQDFRAAYPAWEQLEALRDPALNSRFWQRVTQ